MVPWFGSLSRTARAFAALGVTLASAPGCTVAPEVSGRVDVAPPGAERVQITYLGVGGWIVERGSQKVMTAPLFTNPAFVRTGLAGIASDPEVVNEHMARWDVSDAQAILVGHGHYDHLMDVPTVAKRHAPNAIIIGTETVRNLLGTWSGVADRVLPVEDSAATRDSPGRWIDVGRGVRVLPLLSNHAPHFEGHTLYHGTVDAPRETEPRWATEWLDGPSYAFLVDFLDPDGTVAFRFYYQDAVAAAPRGLAPEALMAERPVDAAVLVPSTFDQVDWHPEAFIENLKPRWVLLGHWENFWVPPETPTRSISMTDMDHFRDRLRRVHDGPHWLPDIGTEFVFPVTRGGPSR